MVVKANEFPDRARVTESDSPDSNPERTRVRALLERFSVMQSFWSEIHDTAREDDRFVAGDQWPQQLREEREDDGRPVLTYNLLPAFNRQIINKVRQERPQIKVIPVESDRHVAPNVPNVQGTRDYSLADVYSGIIKNIEHQSRADHAYDTALKHAVDHGFGYFYLENEWSRTDPFVQDLRIRRVKDSYSVYLDPDAEEVDYSDGQDAFMFTSIQRTAFEKKYPDATVQAYTAGNLFGDVYTGWWDADNIRIAQYYYVDWIDDEVLQLSNGKLVYLSQVEDVLDDMERRQGIHVIEVRGKALRRKVKRAQVKWLKMSGLDILEQDQELPFEHIPIFPVFGDEVMVNGKTRYESAIRHAKDPQRSYNYWRTAAAETVALAPRAPFMLDGKQIEGFEDMYERANRDNQPYLLYKHREGVPPPTRQPPAQVAAAELALVSQDGIDMQTIIGLHDASLGRESNEKSGKAILARQDQGNTSTFQFPDNLGRAQEAMGRVLVEAIPKIYDTQRTLRIRLPDDTDDFVEINATVVDEESGEEALVYDLNYGRYDVVIDTAPNYATQRQEAAENQLELMRTLPPEIASNIAHLVVKNLAVPGSEEIAAVLRKMLPDYLKSEEEKRADLPKGVSIDEQSGQLIDEDGQPYQPPLTPAQQLQQQTNEIEQAKTQADMADARAKQKQAEAKIKGAEADMAEAQAKLAELNARPDVDPEQTARDVQGIVEKTMREHEENIGAHGSAIAEQVSDAIVDALERVRRYVDRQVGALNRAADRPAALRQAPASPSAPSGNGGSMPGAGVQLVMGKRPGKIRFNYDADGNMVSAEPEYPDENAGQRITVEAES